MRSHSPSLPPSLPLSFALSPLVSVPQRANGGFPFALENEFKAAGSIRVDLRVISGQSEINSAGRVGRSVSESVPSRGGTRARDYRAGGKSGP